MAKDTFYFSHDYNVRNDIKIKKLIAKHGYLGFGIFWAIIEDLYNNTNVLPIDYDCIAFELRTTEEVVKSIINDFELFVIEDGFFGSHSVERRLSERNAKSVKARESVLKRWNKVKSDTNVLQTNYDCNTIKESKVKESKELPIGNMSGKEKLPNVKIDFEKLVKFLNDATGRNYHIPNKTIQAKYNARIKEGVTKEKIIKAILTAVEDKYHKENGYKYLTMEFFSRADKIEMYGSEKVNEPIKFKTA